MTNMYPWVDMTKNPIRGKCPHACTYCYVPHSRAKRLYESEPYLVESFFRKGLGSGKTIFMGSCFDIWARQILGEWKWKILDKCVANPNNTYLFQSKDTQAMWTWSGSFPPNVIVGTTVETNRPTEKISNAPCPRTRLAWLDHFVGIDRMISVEPVMDFDLDTLVICINQVAPKFVSIGADSKGHNLPEPLPEKLKELISELQKFTEVKLKKNLDRMILGS